MIQCDHCPFDDPSRCKAYALNRPRYCELIALDSPHRDDYLVPVLLDWEPDSESLPVRAQDETKEKPLTAPSKRSCGCGKDKPSARVDKPKA